MLSQPLLCIGSSDFDNKSFFLAYASSCRRCNYFIPLKILEISLYEMSSLESGERNNISV